ncbi:uncharacterized protein HD556DRAFT_104803 [Suillus plorans]|uniref:Uncharacterized protein n=1 Tax=Suillus plorans TaxID=116603 RepID=A0A9P7ACJ3_9AGAM|nr:uncharacterized protein HD556DRAFT_104803 [Suillus plorans]KAG1785667.1 hypothetical protein HD556DRAFT_104803 [Suillus plorans]
MTLIIPTNGNELAPLKPVLQRNINDDTTDSGKIRDVRLPKGSLTWQKFLLIAGRLSSYASTFHTDILRIYASGSLRVPLSPHALPFTPYPLHVSERQTRGDSESKSCAVSHVLRAVCCMLYAVFCSVLFHWVVDERALVGDNGFVNITRTRITLTRMRPTVRRNVIANFGLFSIWQWPASEVPSIQMPKISTVLCERRTSYVGCYCFQQHCKIYGYSHAHSPTVMRTPQIS